MNNITFDMKVHARQLCNIKEMDILRVWKFIIYCGLT